jgi:indole-3-glycerol phosphate synthase
MNSRPDLLVTIMEERRQSVAEQKRRVPQCALEEAARLRRHRSLVARLRAGRGTGIIAEVKKASPSAGLLCPDYQPTEIARRYEAAGADAVSVLTEPLHFLGSGEDLFAVRQAVDLPVLRKDFISDPYQLWEAAAWGADVVLLIVAALEPARVADLNAAADSLGLEVLIEVHEQAELEAALACPRALIGVNSRNLRTLVTDLAVARELARSIPEDRLAIAESGIRTREDVIGLRDRGYRGFLIGESLLRGPDAGNALRRLAGSE